MPVVCGGGGSGLPGYIYSLPRPPVCSGGLEALAGGFRSVAFTSALQQAPGRHLFGSDLPTVGSPPPSSLLGRMAYSTRVLLSSRGLGRRCLGREGLLSGSPRSPPGLVGPLHHAHALQGWGRYIGPLDSCCLVPANKPSLGACTPRGAALVSHWGLCLQQGGLYAGSRG